ncbi:N-acetylmuramoyl-L-alanine amidase AmiD precursor [Methyloligella halotolerans]|uniref:N-acetylmuramoyl-L-alanine amidase n=1 Tax=Methyloligella halotolerans TaxID=1177755 RepID=A0A1E2S3Q1_9HYPH|nr:N-acetylmuramoyl-L-alanine amidase [Methyloligella halotolerans]ODA69030.1 N-acetylmuramoyl-L-alanine amidase AmiD precursor [Methyloligella halotolerans]
MTGAPDSALAAWRPSPNVEPRRDGRTPDMLLLHYTGMPTAQEALDWLTTEESKVSAHYLIDENGRITQMVPEELRAWHAGQSLWAGETDLNSCSIGIEIHNTGHPAKGESGELPAYPDIQMQAVEALCREILTRHAIPATRVLAHSDIAPTRKQDPGETFDWGRLHAAGIGHWVEPAAIGDDRGMETGDEGARVQELQEALGAYGYGVEITSTYGRGLENVVTAFQRHFRPARIDGRADNSTLETLRHLLDTAPGK